MIRGYYFISDSGLSRAGTLSDVKAAVSAGVTVVQYREKNADTRRMVDEARALREICRGITFLINDRVDVALAVGADGVHLGQNDLPYSAARRILGSKRIIGLTVHSLEEARWAQEAGADYIGAAPIFSTQTKSDAGASIGIDGLKQICQQISIPAAAIGGITPANAADVIAAGADAVCAISAVVAQDDPAGEIRKFQELFPS